MHPYDSVVLITGASRGVGAAAAEAFDRAGAKVALAGSDRAALERVAQRMSAPLVIEADLSRVDDCERMIHRTISHFGRIDVLVNNAAVNRALGSDRVGSDDIHDSMETNFIGPMAATRLAVKEMRNRGRGQIINVSAAGYLLGMPLMAPYAASKAAFGSWTRAMQAEWAGTEILVTEFFLGFVQSDTAADGEGGGEPALQQIADSPWAGLLFRAQSPEEIARCIVDCVREGRSTAYSSFSVRLMAFLGLFARLRVPLAASVARTLRARTGTGQFSPRPSSAASTPVAADGSQSDPAPVTVEPVREAAPAAAAAPAIEPAAPLAIAASADAASAVSPSKDAAPEDSGRGSKQAKPPTKAPAKKRATKKTTRKAATKKTAKKAAAKKKPTKAAAKKTAKKVAALSPEATARVRAAAQRAAASAKGDETSPAKKSSGSEKSSAPAVADKTSEESTDS